MPGETRYWERASSLPKEVLPKSRELQGGLQQGAHMKALRVSESAPNISQMRGLGWKSQLTLRVKRELPVSLTTLQCIPPFNPGVVLNSS